MPTVESVEWWSRKHTPEEEEARERLEGARRGRAMQQIDAWLRQEEGAATRPPPDPPVWITAPAGAAAWWAAVGVVPTAEQWQAWRRQQGRGG